MSEQLCAGLCDTMFTVSSKHMSSSYRSNTLALSHWDPYAVCRVGCLELYYCIIITLIKNGYVHFVLPSYLGL